MSVTPTVTIPLTYSINFIRITSTTVVSKFRKSSVRMSSFPLSDSRNGRSDFVSFQLVDCTRRDRGRPSVLIRVGFLSVFPFLCIVVSSRNNRLVNKEFIFICSFLMIHIFFLPYFL